MLAVGSARKKECARAEYWRATGNLLEKRGCWADGGQGQKEGTSVNETGFGLRREAGAKEHGGSSVHLGKGLFVKGAWDIEEKIWGKVVYPSVSCKIISFWFLTQTN